MFRLVTNKSSENHTAADVVKGWINHCYLLDWRE